MRWANRLVGLVSMLILARLLVPADFGVTAMAAVVLGLASALLDLGVNVAIVRNPDADEEHYHAAWTLRLIQALATAGVIVAASPWAGDYFRDERVTPVLMLMAVNVVIGSLENIGIVSFQKHMQFGREFRYLLINRLFSFFCTVALAFLLRSYWALVIATTVGGVFAVTHSYLVHPMRPRISMGRLKEIFSVSQWMLVQNIGGYVDTNLHRVIVGRRDDVSTMGAYSISSELAAIPSTELLQPLNRVLFPAFVAVKHDLVRLKQAFLLAQSVQVLVALPAATFLAILAPEVVPVLLGPQWGQAVPLLRMLALGYALSAIWASAWYVSITLGHERRSAAVAWSQVAVFLVLAYLVQPDARAEQVAGFRIVVGAWGLGCQLWIVSRALGGLSLGDLAGGIWRAVAALASASAVILLAPWPELPALPSLLAKALGGGLVYFGMTWLLWLIVSRPDGAERYIATAVERAWKSRRRG